jgi:putative intracellular protease/amidase
VYRLTPAPIPLRPGPCFDLPADKDSKRFIQTFYEAGKIVSAVCHAPAVFSDVKLQDGSYLLTGRTITSFTNEEEEQAGMTDMIPWLVESRLVERGATFQKAEKAWGEKVVVDKDSSTGRILITGQNPASAGKMAEEVLKALQK